VDVSTRVSVGKHTGVDSIEQVGALLRLLDVGINEQRVGLGVDVLHHDLEAVEAAGLGDLDLSTETLNQVLIDNAIGGSEEGKNVGDEVALVVVQAVVPVVEILGQVNLPRRSTKEASAFLYICQIV
jgi:hypothetical protein